MQIDPKQDPMFVPYSWRGRPSELPRVLEAVSWMRDIPDTCYLALWQRYPSMEGWNLPQGYDTYIVTFHLEPVDLDWVDEQARRVGDAQMIILFDGEFYTWPHADNVHCFSYLYWHEQLKKIVEWFPRPAKLPLRTHFASTFCSRITQSKLLAFTALAEYIGTDRCFLVLRDWLEEKNVHWRQHTGNVTIDAISDVFWEKYWGRTFTIDEYDESMNFQVFTGDPWHFSLQQVALHFTSETYHYSHMVDQRGDHIRPGPFLTEKTLRCLAGGTAFVPVGQFDTYGRLSRLGLRFDYGFDTAWDQDPGNLSRMVAIIKLIQDLARYSIDDVMNMTQHSTMHNDEHIRSGAFYRVCQAHNQPVIDQILHLVK